MCLEEYLQQLEEQQKTQRLNLIVNDLEQSQFIRQMVELYSKDQQMIISKDNNNYGNNRIMNHKQLLNSMNNMKQFELIAIDLKHLVLDSDFLFDLYLIEYLIKNNQNTIFDIYVNQSNEQVVKEYLQIQTMSYKDDLDLNIKTTLIEGIEQHLLDDNKIEYVKDLIEMIDKQNRFIIYKDALIILPNIRYVQLFKNNYHNNQYQLVDFNRINEIDQQHDKKQNIILISGEYLQFYDKPVFDWFQISTVIDCGYFYNNHYHSELQINYPKLELQGYSQKLVKQQFINQRLSIKEYVQLYQKTKFNQNISDCNIQKLIVLKNLFKQDDSFINKMEFNEKEQSIIMKQQESEMKQFCLLNLNLREFQIFNYLRQSNLHNIYYQMVQLSQKVEISNFREQMNYTNFKDDLNLMINLLIQFNDKKQKSEQLNQWYIQNNLNPSIHYVLVLLIERDEQNIKSIDETLESEQILCQSLDESVYHKKILGSISQFSESIYLQMVSYLKYHIQDGEYDYMIDDQSYVSRSYSDQCVIALSIEIKQQKLLITQGIVVQDQIIKIQKSLSIDKEQYLQSIFQFNSVQIKTMFQKYYLYDLNREFNEMIKSNNNSQLYSIIQYKSSQQKILDRLLKEIENRVEIIETKISNSSNTEYLQRNCIVTDGGIVKKIIFDNQERTIKVQNIPIELSSSQIKEHFIDFEQISKIQKIQTLQNFKDHKTCLITIEDGGYIQDFIDIYTDYEMDGYQIQMGGQLDYQKQQTDDNDQKQKKYILLKTMAYNKQHNQKGWITFIVKNREQNLDIEFMKVLKDKYNLSRNKVQGNKNEIKYRLTKVQKSLDEIVIRQLFNQIHGESDLIRIVDVNLERQDLKVNLREKILKTLQRYLIQNDRNYELKYNSYEIEDNVLEKGEIMIQNYEQLEIIEQSLKDVKFMVAQNYLLHLDKVWIIDNRFSYVEKQIFELEFVKQDAVQQLISSKQIEIERCIGGQNIHRLKCRSVELYDLINKMLMSTIKMKPLKLQKSSQIIDLKIDKIIESLIKNYNFEVEYQQNNVNILGLSRDIEQFTEIVNNHIQNFDEISISLENISLKKFYQQSYQKKLFNLQIQKGILDSKYCFDKKVIQMYMYRKEQKERQDIIESIESLFKELNNKETIQIEQQQQLCELCFDVLDNEYTLINCQHTFCRECIEFTAQVCLKDKSLIPFKCPSCEINVNCVDIEILIPDNQLDKFYQMSIDIFIQQNQKQYAYCIEKQCQSIMYLVDEQYENKFHCNACGYDYCIKCNVKYHYQQSCNDFKTGMVDHLFQQYIQQNNCKKCPKCSFFIFKDGGCNKITCGQCKIHICWCCLKIFKDMNECYTHISKYHTMYDQ